MILPETEDQKSILILDLKIAIDLETRDPELKSKGSGAYIR